MLNVLSQIDLIIAVKTPESCYKTFTFFQRWNEL